MLKIHSFRSYDYDRPRPDGKPSIIRDIEPELYVDKIGRKYYVAYVTSTLIEQEAIKPKRVFIFYDEAPDVYKQIALGYIGEGSLLEGEIVRVETEPYTMRGQHKLVLVNHVTFAYLYGKNPEYNKRMALSRAVTLV